MWLPHLIGRLIVRSRNTAGEHRECVMTTESPAVEGNPVMLRLTVASERQMRQGRRNHHEEDARS